MACRVVDPDAGTNHDAFVVLEDVPRVVDVVPGVGTGVAAEVLSRSDGVVVAVAQRLACIILRLVAVDVYDAYEVPAFIGRDVRRVGLTVGCTVALACEGHGLRDEAL